MYKIKEAIVVEGVYDKNRLAGFIDGVILTTHGFAVFHSDEFAKTFADLANSCGIVILTDSDSAGLKIRNYIKQKARGGKVLHAYVPDIAGKEKRKSKPSAEGLLGVEGMTEDIIIKALRDAGCIIDDRSKLEVDGQITKADMYRLGLSGSGGARELRMSLAQKIGVPKNLSANMLLSVLNTMMTADELEKLISELQ